MLRGFRVGQMYTCHFYNTEKGGVTHISGEGAIGGAQMDLFPKGLCLNLLSVFQCRCAQSKPTHRKWALKSAEKVTNCH